MENNTTIKKDEIDLIALIQRVWESRRSIALFTLIFLVIGILATLFASKEYTASTLMIPRTSGNKAGEGLSGLATMAGISLGGGGGDAVPSTTYTKVIESIPFKKKLIQTPLTFRDLPRNITYGEYMKKYTKPNPLGRVVGIFRSNTPPAEPKMNDSPTVTAISNEERDILNSIDDNIKLDLNEEEGYIILLYVMPEAVPAAQMLQSTQKPLQETVTEFKLQEVKEGYDFIQERCTEAKQDFEAKQYAVAQSQDRNHDLSSNLPQICLQQLQTEYNLIADIYTELTKQLKAKRTKLGEDRPIFTVIEPINVPSVPSKPKRMMIIAIWTFIGLVIGIGSVFLKGFRKQLKEVA